MNPRSNEDVKAGVTQFSEKCQLRLITYPLSRFLIDDNSLLKGGNENLPRLPKQKIQALGWFGPWTKEVYKREKHPYLDFWFSRYRFTVA